MKYKTIFLMMLILSFIFSFASCSNSKNEKNDTNTTMNESTNEAMITMFVMISSFPEHLDEFKFFLDDDIVGGLQEAGNISFLGFQDDTNPERLYLYERWENQEALNTHFELEFTTNVFAFARGGAEKAPPEFLYLEDLLPILNDNDFNHSLIAQNRESFDRATIINIDSEEREDFISRFIEIGTMARAEEGVFTYDFHSVVDNENTFFIFERWSDQELFNQYGNHLNELGEHATILTMDEFSPVDRQK